MATNKPKQESEEKHVEIKLVSIIYFLDDKRQATYAFLLPSDQQQEFLKQVKFAKRSD